MRFADLRVELLELMAEAGYAKPASRMSTSRAISMSIGGHRPDRNWQGRCSMSKQAMGEIGRAVRGMRLFVARADGSLGRAGTHHHFLLRPGSDGWRPFRRGGGRGESEMRKELGATPWLS